MRQNPNLNRATYIHGTRVEGAIYDEAEISIALIECDADGNDVVVDTMPVSAESEAKAANWIDAHRPDAARMGFKWCYSVYWHLTNPGGVQWVADFAPDQEGKDAAHALYYAMRASVHLANNQDIAARSFAHRSVRGKA